MTLASITTLIEGCTVCESSPFGPLTVTTLSFRVTFTPAGMLIGNFPIRDIVFFY